MLITKPSATETFYYSNGVISEGTVMIVDTYALVGDVSHGGTTYHVLMNYHDGTTKVLVKKGSVELMEVEPPIIIGFHHIPDTMLTYKVTGYNENTKEFTYSVYNVLIGDYVSDISADKSMDVLSNNNVKINNEFRLEPACNYEYSMKTERILPIPHPLLGDLVDESVIHRNILVMIEILRMLGNNEHTIAEWVETNAPDIKFAGIDSHETIPFMKFLMRLTSKVGYKAINHDRVKDIYRLFKDYGGKIIVGVASMGFEPINRPYVNVGVNWVNGKPNNIVLQPYEDIDDISLILLEQASEQYQFVYSI